MIHAQFNIGSKKNRDRDEGLVEEEGCGSLSVIDSSNLRAISELDLLKTTLEFCRKTKC